MPNLLFLCFQEQIEALSKRGHAFTEGPLQGGVTAIYVKDKKVYASGDFRRGMESQSAGF